jgi:hypothetical protein
MSEPTPQELGKKKFEVKMRHGKNGVIEKAVFIDGEILDYSIDMTSLTEAMRMGPQFHKAALQDIEKHFRESVSEVVGRKVTAEDIKLAITTGWI